MNAPTSRVPNLQRQVTETLDYYQLDPATTVTIGGAAIAMYGMDARPLVAESGKVFDTDIITDWGELKKIMRRTGYAEEVEFREETGEEPEFFTHNKGKYPIDAFNNGLDFGYDPVTLITLKDAIRASEMLEMNGHPYHIAHPRASGVWKLALGRPKDVFAILKGHGSAHLQGLPLAEDAGWQDVVRQAARMAETELSPDQRTAWFSQLHERPGGLRSYEAFAFLD